MTGKSLLAHVFFRRISPSFQRAWVLVLALAMLVFTGLTLTTRANANRRHRPAVGTLSTSATPGFGSVPVGSVATQTVTIRNSGSANVTVSGASASGAGFTIGGLNVPVTLSIGATASFTAFFTPSALGKASGSIQITSNASNPSLTIPLSGTGTTSNAVPSDVLTADPSSLTFGNVVAGQSTSANITLTNTGTSTVTISQVTAPGAPYTASGVTTNQTIGAGRSATLSLTFSPTTTGSFTGTATIASTATNSPLSISVAGGSHAVSLSWTASTSTLVGYNVYRGTSSGGPYALLNPSLLTGTTYTDTIVTSGGNYYYVVTAVNANGVESAYSNQAPATIPTP